MKELILLSAEKAAVFGLPGHDLTYAQAMGLLLEQNFSDEAARAHLLEAVASGAFRFVGAAETKTARAARIPSEKENTL